MPIQLPDEKSTRVGKHLGRVRHSTWAKGTSAPCRLCGPSRRLQLRACKRRLGTPVPAALEATRES
jgi:hypothetical protein